MLIAAAIAIGLVGYLQLARTSLNLAHRTFFASDASNLAEAGLEETIYCFKQMNSGATPATAWAGWTISGANAMRTLPPFNRDQNAVAIVKIYVKGYDGSDAYPYVISQATLTPFDGSLPIVKIQRADFKLDGCAINGIVARNGLTWKGQSSADSFNSNPTGSPTGPWLPYSSAIARSNTTVIVPAGSLSLGNGIVGGNLKIGAGVTVPPASQVTGSIQTNYKGTFPMPPYPSAASVSKSYNLGSTIPPILPVAGHTAAADGRYYYFVSGTTLASTTITAGKNVTIVGTNTSMSSGLAIQVGASCSVYIDGVVTATGTVSNSNWAGALQIFTTTSGNCSIGNNGQIVACLYAPNAALTASGGGNSGMLVGFFVANTISSSGHMDFHYDEALRYITGGSNVRLTTWLELQSRSDRGTVGTLTNNFLP